MGVSVTLCVLVVLVGFGRIFVFVGKLAIGGVVAVVVSIIRCVSLIEFVSVVSVVVVGDSILLSKIVIVLVLDSASIVALSQSLVVVIHVVVLDTLSIVVQVKCSWLLVVLLVWTVSMAVGHSVCTIVGFSIILGTDAVLVVRTVESELIHVVVLDALSVVSHVVWNSWSVVVLVV